MKPECYFLIGLPASGKSTYRDSLVHSLKSTGRQTTIISSDDYIDKIAHAHGKTYNDVFHDHIGDATVAAFRDMRNAVKRGDNIIVDRTNMSRKSRAQFLNLLSKDYVKYAVIFIIDEKTRKERAAKRHGKAIPDHVIDSMNKSYQSPTFEEFDYIMQRLG